MSLVEANQTLMEVENRLLRSVLEAYQENPSPEQWAAASHAEKQSFDKTLFGGGDPKGWGSVETRDGDGEIARLYMKNHMVDKKEANKQPSKADEKKWLESLLKGGTYKYPQFADGWTVFVPDEKLPIWVDISFEYREIQNSGPDEGRYELYATVRPSEHASTQPVSDGSNDWADRPNAGQPFRGM